MATPHTIKAMIPSFLICSEFRLVIEGIHQNGKPIIPKISNSCKKLLIER